MTFACGMAVLALGQVGARGLQQASPRPLDGGRTLLYFVSHGEDGTGYRPSDRDLAIWAFEAWERGAAGGFHLEPRSEADALVRVYWVRPNGSYGETRPLSVGGIRAEGI